MAPLHSNAKCRLGYAEASRKTRFYWECLMRLSGFAVGLVSFASLSAAAWAEPAGQVASSVGPLAADNVRVRTLPLDPGLALNSATYTPSGRVLVSYRPQGSTDGRDLTLVVMNDDGRGARTIFKQRLPDRPKDNGVRYMVFPDNKRVFLGDFILECAPSLDRCGKTSLLPVEYPAEVAEGDHIDHRWSEMIVAPDNRHVAWTTLLTNYVAAPVLTGALKRTDAGYAIVDPHIVSTSDPFIPDPKHADGVLPQTLRGGEVKQFVHGGTALSLAGAVDRDIPDSVVQDLASGKVEAITHAPGYDETTIFSPDERLGLVMTTRFSPTTDPAILGLVPRPYPASLNMGLSMFAYTYSVTGVRKSRPGNVGPALIDIEQSRNSPDYLGINLGTGDGWVFNSPLSWHPDSTKGMWIESQRGTGTRRVRIVEIPGYSGARPVAAKATPAAVHYGSSDLSIIPTLIRKTNDTDVRVYGRVSGHIEYRRRAGEISKTYVNFSDDGRSTYTGRETTRINMRGNSTYVADLNLSGPNPGSMKLTMTFGPLGGDQPARLVFDPDASGAPVSRGYAEYRGKRLTVDQLVP